MKQTKACHVNPVLNLAQFSKAINNAGSGFFVFNQNSILIWFDFCSFEIKRAIASGNFRDPSKAFESNRNRFPMEFTPWFYISLSAAVSKMFSSSCQNLKISKAKFRIVDDPVVRKRLISQRFIHPRPNSSVSTATKADFPQHLMNSKPDLRRAINQGKV